MKVAVRFLKCIIVLILHVHVQVTVCGVSGESGASVTVSVERGDRPGAGSL